jgi:hypothetical protein
MLKMGATGRDKRVRFFKIVLAVFLIFQISMPVGVQYLASTRNVSVAGHREFRPRVAVVKPVFTATAYSSFYKFYAKYVSTQMNQIITSDLALLNATLVDSWGWSDSLQKFLTSSTARENGLALERNLTTLSDVSVTEGRLLYENGTRRFDVVILGFAEYVTSQEYSAFKHFVADGGRLIFVDATNFFAEVRYYSQTNHLALVKGHGWGFDGKKVWHDVRERWSQESTNWVASNFCCFGYGRRYDGAFLVGANVISRELQEKFGSKVFLSYHGHEENRVTNNTFTEILAQWSQLDTGSHSLVAAYIHRYRHGTVIHIGVMASDVISYDKSVQFFLIRSVFS